VTPRAFATALLARRAAVDDARARVDASERTLAEARQALADAADAVASARAERARHHAPAASACPARLALWRAAGEATVADALARQAALEQARMAASLACDTARQHLRACQAEMRAIEIAEERRRSAERQSAIRREHEA
jgi:hypothetical protein